MLRRTNAGDMLCPLSRAAKRPVVEAGGERLTQHSSAAIFSVTSRRSLRTRTKSIGTR